MTAVSRYSSSKSKRSTIISSFWTRSNLSIRALHMFTLVGITASASYVSENGVSPVDLRGVVRYVHKMLGSFSAQLPLAPSSLLFNPFKIVLLMASSCPLLWGYVGVEYLFVMSRSRQKSRKALLSNCSPLSEIKVSGTPNLVLWNFKILASVRTVPKYSWTRTRSNPQGLEWM